MTLHLFVSLESPLFQDAIYEEGLDINKDVKTRLQLSVNIYYKEDKEEAHNGSCFTSTLQILHKNFSLITNFNLKPYGEGDCGKYSSSLVK